MASKSRGWVRLRLSGMRMFIFYCSTCMTFERRGTVVAGDDASSTDGEHKRRRVHAGGNAIVFVVYVWPRCETAEYCFCKACHVRAGKQTARGAVRRKD